MMNAMFGINYFAPSGLGETWLLKGGLHPPLRSIAPSGLGSILALKGCAILKKGIALRIRVKAQKALKGRNKKLIKWDNLKKV
jgi:hypothetical protein